MESQNVLSRLEKIDLWRFACEIDPEFKAKMNRMLTGLDYRKSIQRAALIWAHTRISSMVISGKPGTEFLRDVPPEVIASPSALNFLVSHREFIPSVISGDVTLCDLINMRKLEI